MSDCTGCQNLSNLTHQVTREMCLIVQDVGIFRFYFSEQKYFEAIHFCRMPPQDVRKLRCQIAQVPLYLQHHQNDIGGVIFCVLASCAVDRWFKSLLGQTNYYKTGCPLSFETGGTMGYNCCFFLIFVLLHIESPYNFGGTGPILGV